MEIKELLKQYEEIEKDVLLDDMEDETGMNAVCEDFDEDDELGLYMQTDGKFYNRYIVPAIKDLKKGLTIMMNEAIDMQNAELPIEQQQELVNEKQVGRIISEVGFEETTKIIMGLSKESTETEESSKNV